MDLLNDMVIRDQLKKHFTGTKTPSNERLRDAVIVFLIIFFLGTLVGFGTRLWITKNFLEKSNADFTLGAFDKDSMGYYFPLKITNSGQKDLIDTYLTFQNCYMDKPREYKIEKLIPTNFEIFKLRDQKTISLFTKKPCNADINFSMEDCKIRSYKINSTHLYVPTQYCSIYMCDFCEYKARIKSAVLKDEKIFDKLLYGPKEIKLKVTPNNLIEIGDRIPIKELYPIGINFFNEQELCIWDGDCFVHDLKFGPYLPKLPIYFNICPKENLTCMNVSINYLNIPSFSRYE